MNKYSVRYTRMQCVRGVWVWGCAGWWCPCTRIYTHYPGMDGQGTMVVWGSIGALSCISLRGMWGWCVGIGLSSSVYLSVYFRCKKYSVYYFSFDHCLHRNILLTIDNFLPRPSAIFKTEKIRTIHRQEPSPEGGWPTDMHSAMLYSGVEKECPPIMIDDHLQNTEYRNLCT
jgi:hypothetical protein